MLVVMGDAWTTTCAGLWYYCTTGCNYCSAVTVPPPPPPFLSPVISPPFLHHFSHPSFLHHISTISPTTTTTTTTRVFPLKGKLLNVRDASKKQLLGNAEVQNIMKIMGLKLDTKYVNSDDAWWWYSWWYSCWNFHDRPHYANTSSEHGVALIVVLNVVDV